MSFVNDRMYVHFLKILGLIFTKVFKHKIDRKKE